MVIPTKNRSAILLSTLESLRLQTFQSFECIVVDNDDTNATARAFTSLTLPSNFRIVKTGGLPMADNWDFAVKQAKGDFLIILEDKTLIRLNLLELLSDYFCSHLSTECISWLQDTRDVDSLDWDSFVVGHVNTQVLSSESILRRAFKSDWHYVSRYIPRGFNSAISRRIYQGTGSADRDFRLCRPNSPDYSLGFQTLFLSPTITHWNTHATTINSNSPSNGSDCLKKGQLFNSFLKETGITIDSLFCCVPSKVFSLHNALTNELILLTRRYGIEKCFSLNSTLYYCNISYELLLREQMGLMIEDDLRQFREETNSLPTTVRIRVVLHILLNHSATLNRWGINNLRRHGPITHVKNFFFD